MKTLSHVARALLLVLTLLGAARLSLLPASATQNDPSFDLAATVLTPYDLEDAGLDGYGNDLGNYLTRAELATWFARDTGESVEDALEIYEELGLLHRYSVRLALPIEDGGYIDDTTEGLWINLVEYESRADATAALTRSEDNDIEDGLEIVDDAPEVGDASYVSRYDGDDPESGDPTIELHLNAVVDSITVSLQLYDVARDGERTRASEPDLDTLIDLGEVQTERIEDAPDDDLPTLGLQILRLTDDDGSIYTVGDRYASIDGAPLRRYGDADDLMETRAENMENEGIVASYGVEQDVRSGADEIAGEPHITVRLYQFEHDDDAANWADDFGYDRFAAESYIDDAERIDLDVASAGTMVAATYLASYGDAEIIGVVAWVQVDDHVARITLDATDEIDLDVLETLLDAQIDCLDAPACDAVQVPSEITDLL